jgi:Ca-activated chloride channel family protein
MDEESLTRIAAMTGGRYFRARSTAQLEEIYGLLDELEPVAQDPEVYRPVVSLYHWPLGLAWLIVAGLVLLRVGRIARV